MESLQTTRAISSTARPHGLSRSLLMTWRRSFSPEPTGTEAQQAGFVPAMVVATETAPTESAAPASGRMEIIIGRDRRIIVDAGVDADFILLEGVNDLTVPAIFNLPQQTITADQLIGAYRQIIARAHAHGIKVIGGTILPFGAIRFPNAFTPATEAMREADNKFILESGEFDGAIDFATAVADPKNPTFLAAQ